MHAWEALIHASDKLNDAQSFLCISITPQLLVGFGSFSLQGGWRVLTAFCAAALLPCTALKVGSKVGELQTLTPGLHTAPWL